MKTKQTNSKVSGYSIALTRLLHIFADLYKFPDKELYEEINSGQLDQEIRELSRVWGNVIEADLRNSIGTYDDLVNSYNACFLGVKKPFAPPVESIYKEWTSDESYQIPHKKEKGYLMGDAALHIKHILQAFNLQIPQEYEMMPDHLTILLELYAYLIEQGFGHEADQFRRDHLDWLADFAEKLQMLPESKPYVSTTSMLIEALKKTRTIGVNKLTASVNL